MCEILIVGLGNILMSDDGIGISVLNELEILDPFEKALYLDLGTSSYELVNHLDSSVKKLVLIDCLLMANKPPGKVFKLGIEDIKPDDEYKLSLHQQKLFHTLNLISIDNDLPDTCIIGIIPYDYKTISIKLSDQLRKEFDSIVKTVAKYIRDFIDGN